MSDVPQSGEAEADMLEEFETLLQQFERAARGGDLAEFRRLDHVLRSKALALIGGMPDMEPSDESYVDALRNAVARLGTAAGEIQQERQMLKARRQSDQKVRLAYSRK